MGGVEALAGVMKRKYLQSTFEKTAALAFGGRYR